MSNKEVKVTNYSNGKGAKIDIYSPNSKTKPHDSVHIKVNYDSKSYNATTKINGQKSQSSGGCYLISACMAHLQEKFNNECYELLVLRWCKDNFVLEEDIAHYYETAPIIVEAINGLLNSNLIYENIYKSVILPCVKAIEVNNYEFAYNRYKESILELEGLDARSYLEQKLTRTLSKI